MPQINEIISFINVTKDGTHGYTPMDNSQYGQTHVKQDDRMLKDKMRFITNTDLNEDRQHL